MKIATLQLNSHLGEVQRNIDHANELLDQAGLKPAQVDLLVLPEMAFSGYNFPSLDSIRPFLEPTANGPSAKWAITTARRLDCHVIVGYPEKCLATSDEPERFYNSTVTVSPQGQVVATYRKSFLYYTDETWALEGPNGSSQRSFNSSELCKPFLCGEIAGLGRVGHGICMDINPYKFEASYGAYEFATLMLKESVPLVVLSMAWLTRLLPFELDVEPNQPDMATLSYWVERFSPLLESARGEDVTVVFANRCGVEDNAEMREGHVVKKRPLMQEVCYAGSSCVLTFRNGQVGLYDRDGASGILGKSEEGVLVVDTSKVSSLEVRKSVNANVSIH